WMWSWRQSPMRPRAPGRDGPPWRPPPPPPSGRAPAACGSPPPTTTSGPSPSISGGEWTWSSSATMPWRDRGPSSPRSRLSPTAFLSVTSWSSKSASAERRVRHGRRLARLRRVADGLAVVAAGVPPDAAVVVRVVLGPHPRLVERLGAGGEGGVEERPHGGPGTGAEGDVRLTEALARLLWTDPEVRHGRHSVADDRPEVHDASATDGR